MAKCSKCGKKAVSGNTRSHSNQAKKRRFKVNIQTKKINGAKTKICTGCIRTMHKIAA